MTADGFKPAKAKSLDATRAEAEFMAALEASLLNFMYGRPPMRIPMLARNVFCAKRVVHTALQRLLDRGLIATAVDHYGYAEDFDMLDFFGETKTSRVYGVAHKRGPIEIDEIAGIHGMSAKAMATAIQELEATGDATVRDELLIARAPHRGVPSGAIAP